MVVDLQDTFHLVKLDMCRQDQQEVDPQEVAQDMFHLVVDLQVVVVVVHDTCPQVVDHQVVVPDTCHQVVDRQVVVVGVADMCRPALLALSVDQ